MFQSLRKDVDRRGWAQGLEVSKPLSELGAPRLCVRTHRPCTRPFETAAQLPGGVCGVTEGDRPVAVVNDV